MKKWKVGDWCFCQFKLMQIVEMEGDVVTSVTDGSFRLSSSSLNNVCFELNLRNKNISDTVAYYSDKVHQLKHNALNHPDINRELIKRWVEMCLTNGERELKEMYESIGRFYQQIHSYVDTERYKTIEGVSIIR